jgi:hypothetical protein
MLDLPRFLLLYGCPIPQWEFRASLSPEFAEAITSAVVFEVISDPAWLLILDFH